MKKFISLAMLVLLNSCFQSSTTNDQETTKALLPVSNVKTTNNLSPLLLDNFPDRLTDKVSADEKEKVTGFLKKQNIFSLLPPTNIETYLAHFTSDGTPAYLTSDGIPAFNKGLTRDGSPAFFTKDVSSSPQYFWNRKENKLLLDYFLLTNTTEKSWGLTNYARYSQVLEHKITVSGTKNNQKTVNLIKTMGFGLVKQGDNYQLQSVTPIVIRKPNRDSMAYHIINVSLTTDKSKIIIPGYRKLIPLPGISISKHLGSHKVRVQLHIRLINEDAADFAVIASIKDRQYELQRIAGPTYGGDIELPELAGPESLVFELIDKKSLEQNDDYNGYTFIIPVTG